LPTIQQVIILKASLAADLSQEALESQVLERFLQTDLVYTGLYSCSQECWHLLSLEGKKDGNSASGLTSTVGLCCSREEGSRSQGPSEGLWKNMRFSQEKPRR
jgi:hypothetical protein